MNFEEWFKWSGLPGDVKEPCRIAFDGGVTACKMTIKRLNIHYVARDGKLAKDGWVDRPSGILGPLTKLYSPQRNTTKNGSGKAAVLAYIEPRVNGDADDAG